MNKGTKKTVWFSKEQLKIMNRIVELSGNTYTISSAIREGLELLLAKLERRK